MWTVLITGHVNGPALQAITYTNGREPALFYSKEQAVTHAKELAARFPCGTYEVFKLVEDN